MPIIAMTREMGSLGKDVAEGVAKALGVPLVYHEIIDVLADKMRVRKSHVMRLLDGHTSLFDRLTADTTSLSIYTVAEICHLATQTGGAVFRGWGAVQVLRDVPHAVCVHVCAPRELRVRRMMDRLGTTDERRVEQEIDASDEAAGAVIRRNFHTDWRDASHYDLILNTERLTAAHCVEEILKLVESERFAETDASRQILADLALRAAARAALRAAPDTRRLQLSVAAERGRITLDGIVNDDTERALAEQIVARVPGSAGVVNQLRATTDLRSRFA
jgi:cytidylate kinase